MIAPPAAPLPYPSGWRRAFALRHSMADFGRRGFRDEPVATRCALEAVARTFLDGFNAELASPAGAAPDFTAVATQRRGFAVEGAGMAAVLLDTLRPAGGQRLAILRAAYDDQYSYLIQVGVGWAMAKLHSRRPLDSTTDAPLLRWLAYDGMGFCQAFFAGRRGLRRWYAHPSRCPDTCDIGYQGMGRCLWFRACGDPDVLAGCVAGLPERHRGDAWSGIGLAACYAGSVAPDVYPRLLDRSGVHAPALAQGVAFAAEAWRRCGYAPEHAHTAVRTLAGVSLEEAAAWTWTARRGLDGPDTGPAGYRQWRLRIQEQAAAVAHQ